jgi:hypothetical protein
VPGDFLLSPRPSPTYHYSKYYISHILDLEYFKK